MPLVLLHLHQSSLRIAQLVFVFQLIKRTNIIDFKATTSWNSCPSTHLSHRKPDTYCSLPDTPKYRPCPLASKSYMFNNCNVHVSHPLWTGLPDAFSIVQYFSTYIHYMHFICICINQYVYFYPSCACFYWMWLYLYQLLSLWVCSRVVVLFHRSSHNNTSNLNTSELLVYILKQSN